MLKCGQQPLGNRRGGYVLVQPASQRSRGTEFGERLRDFCLDNFNSLSVEPMTSSSELVFGPEGKVLSQTRVYRYRFEASTVIDVNIDHAHHHRVCM